jgi:RNA polymerase sigma-70 factor (ECF subfamily)
VVSISQIRETNASSGISLAEYDTAYIVCQYGDMMYKLATAQINNKSDAYDAVQDVLLKVHIKKPVWDSPEHVKAWLIRAVINQCRDYNRKNRGSVELCDVYEVAQNSPDYELQEALANLPEKYRVVLYLHYYDGYKVHEIAKILKVGESGIKKRLVKAREMLKGKLEEGDSI